MRSLALILVLANITFFVWQQSWLPWLPWQPEQFVPVSAGLPNSSLPTLLLLSEQPSSANEKTSPPKSQPSEENQSTVTPPASPVENKVNTTPSEDTQKKSEENKISATPPTSTAENIEQKAKVEEKTGVKTASNSTLANNSEQTPSTAHTPTSVAEKQARPADEDKKTETGTAEQKTTTTDTSKTDSGEKVEKKTSDTDEHTVTASENEQTTKSSDKTTQDPKKAVELPSKETKTENSTELTLLSTNTPPAEKTGKETNQDNNICVEIGPFANSEATQETENWFKNKKAIATKIEQRDTPMVSSTWVYLPAFPSKQKAQEAQRRLEKRGITDHLIVNGGKFNNAISLGLYKDQLSVERRLEQLKTKGFKDAQTEKRYKNQPKYWLHVTLLGSQNDFIKDFKASNKNEELKTVSCE